MKYCFGAFHLDTSTAQLHGPEGDIAVRPMTLRLLQVLIESAPNLQTHEQLLDQVWGRQAVSVGVVAQSVRELRRALGDAAQAPTYIETRHRMGYRFIAPVERAQPSPAQHSPAAIDPPLAGDLPASNAPPIGRRPDRESVDGAAGPMRNDDAASAAAPGRQAAEPGSGRSGRGLALVLALLAVAAVAVGLGWRHRAAPTPDPGTAADPSTQPALANAGVLQDVRPQRPEAAAAYLEGLRAERAQDLHAASSAFEAALQVEPGAVAAMAALARVHRQSGDLRAARSWGEAALQASAALPRIERLRLEGLVASIHYRHDEAARALQAVFGMRPGDAESGLRLFDAQLAAGRPADALATLQALEQLQSPQLPRERLQLAHARAAVLRGDHQARLQAGRDAETHARTPHHRVEALLEQASALLLLGQRPAAHRALQQADALASEAQWPAGAMRVHLLAGTLAREDGNLEQALAQFARAQARAEPLGHHAVAAAARREQAYVLLLSGELGQARERLHDLEQLAAALSDLRELASTLDVAALVAQRSGDPDAARALVERALGHYVDAGDRVGEASARSNLGMLLARSGRFDDASTQMQQALALFRGHGDVRGSATALGNLAAVHARSGRSVAAREANEQALALFRQLGATLDVARLQFNLGLQDRRAGDVAATADRLTEALQGFTAAGAQDLRLQALASLAELHLQRADLVAAEALLADAGDASGAAPQRQAAIATAQARLAVLRNQLEAAEADFERAHSLRTDAGLEDWVLASTLDLAQLAARRGALVQAERAALSVRRAMLERADAHGAIESGLVLAGVRAARGESNRALLDTLEGELGAYADAALRLRLDLTRASQHPEQRASGLQAVAADARSMGFELLALRAELLAGGALAEQAAATLTAAGVGLEGMPPGLPF